MKTTWKWMIVMALAAVTARAGQDGFGGAPCEGMPPPPCGERMMPPPGGDGCPPPCMKGHRGCPGMPPHEACGGEARHMGPTPEQREEFAAFRALCKAVRGETDEAKKAEMVEELRAKLGKMADEQCERQKARLAAAEERIAEQKARLDAQVEALRAMIDDAEAHRAEWIDEQVECILSGERPPMRRMHHGKCGADRDMGGPEGCPGPRQCRGKGKGGPKDGGRCFKRGCHGKHGCEGVPPPPPEEEGGELPPPPEGEE